MNRWDEGGRCGNKPTWRRTGKGGRHRGPGRQRIQGQSESRGRRRAGVSWGSGRRPAHLKDVGFGRTPVWHRLGVHKKEKSLLLLEGSQHKCPKLSESFGKTACAQAWPSRPPNHCTQHQSKRSQPPPGHFPSGGTSWRLRYQGPNWCTIIIFRSWFRFELLKHFEFHICARYLLFSWFVCRVWGWRRLLSWGCKWIIPSLDFSSVSLLIGRGNK